MAQYERDTFRTRAESTVAIDEGLRGYMLRVYNYIGAGLVITGLVAFFTNMLATTTDAASAAAVGAGQVAQISAGTYLTSFGMALYGSPLQWIVMLSPLAFVMVLSFGINKLSASTAQLLFWRRQRRSAGLHRFQQCGYCRFHQIHQ